MVLLAAWASGLACAAETAWRSTGTDGELTFTASYEGEAVRGRFVDFEVKVAIDDASGQPRSLSVRVAAASADLADPEINDEMRQAEWFDSARYPDARFESHDIAPGAGGFLARGELTIKNLSRPLELGFTLADDGTGKRLAGTVVLSRTTWQVGSGEWAEDSALAETVEVGYRVTLQQAAE